MHPILLHIGKFTLHTYGVLLMVGFALGLWRTLAAVKRYKDDGITQQDVLDIAVWVLIGGILFARVFFVFLDPNWRDLLPQFLAVWNGGISFDGALFGVILAIVVFCRMRKIPFLAMTDLIAPSAVLAYAIGRVGCFFNGCCYGQPTNLPWGVRFYDSDDGGALTPPSHPTQLYSTALSIILFGFMVWRERTGRAFRGELFCWYLMGSAIERFIMEIWRAGATSDMVRGTPFTTAQFFCFALFAVGLGAWFFLRRSAQPKTAAVPAPSAPTASVQ
ncbi:MAG TPA: prolipoprotein diacylglyceryl transferase [Capsulimonadaceae bacterium]|nr:prolipoprotein diacylglyceryl transferase [Capsulimonadaceae bacterium]